MTVANLVLQYVKTLIWPTVVILAAVVFRGEVKGLFRRLTSLTGAGFDLKFEAEVREALQSAQATVGQLLKEERKDEESEAQPSTAREEAASDALREVALRSPEAAIMGAWRLVEIRINDLMLLLPFPPDPSKVRTVGMQINYLRNYLPPGLVEAIERLRQLRNRVAHREQASPQAAADYVATALIVLEELDSLINEYGHGNPASNAG